MSLRYIEMLKEKIIKVDRIIYISERYFIITLLFLMIILSFAQVILRLLFKNAIAEIEIFVRNLVMISCLFASSAATYHSSHFRIEVAERFLSEKSRKNLYSFSQLLIVFSSLLILIQTIRFIELEIGIKNAFMEIISLKLDIQHLILFLPIIFFNISFHAFSNILKKQENK
ncbi:MAG: TRAP transporter small permease [Elusimicrobiales bacterium]